MPKLIMVRSARDEYEAVEVASAMEEAGADVFCIKNALELGDKNQLVYCKVSNSAMCDAVDDAITRMYEVA